MNSSVDEILNSYSLCESMNSSVTQIRIEQRSDYRWRRSKAFGNDVLPDSESIATKLCSQNSRISNAMFESHVVREVLVTSVDRTSFDFQFEDFLSNLPL